jgi:hypothetical protein
VKIVLLHGRNHKGSTYHVAHRIVEKIENKKKIAEINAAYRAPFVR